MAEAILFDIAARIIESLGSHALKEIGLLWGVTDELEKLKNTVSTIQAVLLDAEEQSAVNCQVRDWLEKLKDVVYDADDLLDGFFTEHLLREMMTRDKMAKKVRIFLSKSNQLVYNFKMGHKIKAIRQKLDAISNDRTKFHLDERPVEIGVRARNTHSYKEILKRLLSDSENVGILPITGIRGLGKTTLAQFIFNDEEIDKHFQLKMWACVSESFEVEKVIGKILESMKKKKPDVSGMDALGRILREEIGGKKYLLVLDDVWNEDVKKWDDLKVLLEVGASGSRILITTRSKIIAQITQTIAEYSLQCLDERESWCLFKQVAFENGQEPVNSRKVEVGKEIVEKCSGVPLVIKTIGRLLSLENSEEGWVSFKNNKLQKIKENDILPTLKLSYDQLPSHLKQCFAYYSIFPKDYVMEKSKLINLWIAKGFIKPPNQNECLEDVGHEYFMDLLWRSFFQEAEMDDLGNVFMIKMHDLMHDLASSVAGSLITRLESEEKSISDLKTQHVSVVGNIDFSLVIRTSSSKASKTRTLLCLGESENLQDFSSTSCEAIFSSLKFLRVLGLDGRQFDLVPSSICKLKHLRDLDLSWNEKIKKLPDSISRLQNLYSLRLSSCSSLEELPRGITKLVNLRHLYNDESFFPSLEQIVINYCPNLKGWWRRSDSYNVDVNTTDHALLLFPRLSELIIEQCPMLTSLPMFPHLEEKLVLENASWKPVQQTITNASSSSASSTPIAFSSPPLSKLKTIFLSGIHDLETLPVQNLVSLQHLTIADCPMLDLGNDEHGMQWKGLKSLISLGFTGMPKLVSLPLGLQHVTSLRRLQISDCSSLLAIPEWICNWASLEEFTISKCSGLTSLPEAMSRLTSLKTLKIYDCPILLRRCEQERGEDWPKIAHIPKLDFRLPYLG
ncbi:hypothetical protein CIPAW_13G157000 [Carya illinoinensis]|uniref:Disease resistance protein RGA3 n=1 Tax=Carya illinoinensis TaxID=32201 RepID=A0A8T1NSF5_CARIL|nr:hypothetical protein CIPAW_13G157000 [Carya illinoinensis]